jgi:hypothetical protein
MRSRKGCLSGCFTQLALLCVVGLAFAWGLIVVLHPWALHIGGRSTPLLYWQGTGTVVSKDGKAYPLYVTFWPGRSAGRGGRREGKIISARLGGTGWLCIAPGNVERMQLSGSMYGGYTSDADSILDFRLLEWRKAFQLNPPNRGFFDVAGTWHNGELVMTRPGEQGIRFLNGIFIDDATVTLRWAKYSDFESACRNMSPQTKR